MLSTAAGEVVPLTSDGDDWYLKVLINNEYVYIRIDVWVACHECPPSWVRCLSLESVERRTSPGSTTITKTRKGLEVKHSSSPEQIGAAGKPRHTMLEDVDELILSRDEEIEVLRSLSSWNPCGGAYDNSTCRNTGKGKGIQKRQRPTEMDDAELIKDLRGLGKPPLFDGNVTDVSFFPVSEDDSILSRRTDDVVDTGPDQHHRAIGEMDNQMNQHIEMPHIQRLLLYSDKFRREPPRPRHPSTLEQWPASISGMTDQVETPTTVSIYLELDCFDDVGDGAFKVESGKTNVSLTIASGAGKQRIFTLTGLAHEITGVKVAQKKGKQTVSLKLAKKEKKTLHKLLDDASTKEVVADDTRTATQVLHLVSAKRH